ncbi:hypothetical protein DEA8626_00869 [Defluviimonas aquaemixtae]|uniref:Glycosyl transferase family 25 domain-containing protein n=1 Tax=Albidovulum aquaemixtae TaxID=1542388 RepID=A0A2R8B3X8_9RHOB|nr:glycosyltransferase family 25 protein [Defluviimonas aquaemixtae]SPH17351.1 hypothetical protein DEA8626_00869 [Defluviimonas aquaemixtae]
MLPVHVINLTRRPDRLAAIAVQLDDFGLAWHRAEAIDAAERGADALARDFGIGPLTQSYPATPGDMACSISHRKLWQEIAGLRSEAAIVLEDDATLSEDFRRIASCDLPAVMRRHGMGVLKLEFWPGPQLSRRRPVGEDLGPISGATRLYRMRSSFLGSCGYVITTEAARRLLSAFRHLQVPVDHFLFGQSAGLGFDALRPGFLNPAPVLHDVERYGSDIKDQRPCDADRARGWRRRLRDHRQRRREEALLRRGLAERVEMRFAGSQHAEGTVG